MLCSSFSRHVIQAGYIGSRSERWQFATIWRNLNAAKSLTFLKDCKFTLRRNMMVDTAGASATTKGGLIGDVLPEKDDDGGYASGGWKSEDGSLSCGYSSFRGKRVSMEDFYDIKTSKIDGRTVCLFGIFDGHGGSRAAEYLKRHLFENLMKHPEFITDTKLAITFL